MMSVVVTPLYRSQARVWPLPMVITWIIWRRNRSALTGICLFLAVMALLANTIFAGVLAPLAGLFGPDQAAATDGAPINYVLVVSVFSAVMMALLWCSVIVAVSAGLFNAGATAKDYPYPGYLMRAPVSSVGLAACPVSIGTTMMVVLWLFSNVAIFRPLGFAVPMGESVLSAALLVAFLPAAMWSPLSPGMKGLFMLVLGSALTVVLVAAHHASSGISYIEWISAGIFMSLCAVAGLERMRQGEMYKWTWPNSIVKLQERFRSSPRMLASALAAQRSLEWRGTGGALPWAVIVCTLLSLPVLLVPDTYPLADHSSILQGIYVILWAVVMQIFVIGIPFYTAMLSLLQVGNDYMLTRPMSSQWLAAARLYAGARSAAFTVLLSGLLFAAWLATPAYDGHYHAALGSLLLRHGGQAFARTMAFYALIWVMLIFRLRLDGYSTSLSGSQALGGWNLLADYMFVVLIWVNLPQLNLVNGGQAVVLQAWAYVLFTAKAVLGACVLGHIVRHRLVRHTILIKAGALWIGTAAAVYIIAAVTLPRGVVSLEALAVGVFLAMPLVRLSLGPVLLDRNRHR